MQPHPNTAFRLEMVKAIMANHQDNRVFLSGVQLYMFAQC